MDKNPTRRWFRFRLSTVLILTAIVAWAMATRPIWNHRFAEGRSLKYRGVYHPDLPKGAQMVRRSTHSFRPAFTPPGLTVDVCDWQVDEKRLNQRLIWPAIAFAAFLAWKAAWTIGPRLIRRRPAGMSTCG
jgi:hypothetical protein